MENYNPKFRLTKFACYSAYFTMASIFCVPPLLFVTFREMYGISYTLLGTLVLVNFFTQLCVDIVFTLFARHFNTKLIVRVMPIITSLGLTVYALVPLFFSEFAYIGLLVGSVIFSVSAGLSEVLLSPTIAAIPSDNPQRDMSLLHSLYAFGVVFMVLFTTAYIKIFGSHNWIYLILFLALLPIGASALFMASPMPDMKIAENTDTTNIDEKSKHRTIGLVLCVACIFFGSCAENTMSNWISGYMENALKIDKTVGDILGVAVFAILLGIARISYAKFGKNIFRVLMVGMIGATVCYLVAGFSGGVILPFLACIFTGLFTSMLWPGTLILMEEKIPRTGVTAFALMAAGGDLGAAGAPQLMGIVIDKVAESSFAGDLAVRFNITAEQVGMRTSMIVTSIFPILGIVVLILIHKHFSKNESM